MGGDSRTSEDHKTPLKQIIHGGNFHFRFLQAGLSLEPVIALMVRFKGRRVNHSATVTKKFAGKILKSHYLFAMYVNMKEHACTYVGRIYVQDF